MDGSQQPNEERSGPHPLRIKSVDLNLLKVFEAVMTNGSVSGAARALGVTASAVSHSLARLRVLLGDELFVLGDSGMAPTERALAIAPHVSGGLEKLALALRAHAFDPGRAVRTFRVAATDNTCMAVLAPLVGRLSRRAPHVNLRVFPPGRTDAVRLLDDGRLDVALGWFADLPDRMRHAVVTMDVETIIVRPGHPLSRGEVTTRRLFGYPHLAVDLTGSEEHEASGFMDDRGVFRRTWIERLLVEMSDDSQGLVGRVAVTVPSYAAVPALLLASDMVATVPRRIAVWAAERDGVVMLDLPYLPLEVEILAVWHQRSDQDAGLRWLVAEMVEAVRGELTKQDDAAAVPSVPNT